MPFDRTENHDDLLTLNGFAFEVNGVRIAAVTNVGGFVRTAGEIEWVDGGTGYTEYFIDQKKMFGPITIKYRIDPTKTDVDLLRNFVTASIGLGVKFDFALVKYHHGSELFRILVYRGLFKSETWSEFDKNGAGPVEVDMEVPCSFWEIIQTGL